jgi:hypothetical protein
MAAGELDPARARVLGEWTEDLADSHAVTIVENLLPKCRLSASTRLTTGQLVDEIKTQAIALDPNWAQRRYENAVARRRVTASRNPEGTANFGGRDLPVERVAGSSRHVDALARSAKQAGDWRPIDHIRSELFLGMTDGEYEGLDKVGILRAVLASARAQAEQASQAAAADPGPEPPSEPQPDPARNPAAEPDPADLAELLAREADRVPAKASSWAGVHLRVRLSTQLGLDRWPGEMAGWGAVHAELAGQLIERLGAAQWRFIFTCRDGFHLRDGLLRSRPQGSLKRKVACQAVVEIVVPVDLLPLLENPDALATIDPQRLRDWSPVLLELRDRLDDPETRKLLDPHRRFPGAALRREVIASIKNCVGVGCRAPSATTDIDHLTDHAKGGLTTKVNLDPACRHDHRVKTEAGWMLRRVDDTFEWTTRLGHVYLVPIPPVLPPLPDPIDPDAGPVEPVPPPDPDRDVSGEPWQRSTSWDESRHDADRPPGPEPSEPDEAPAEPDEPRDHWLVELSRNPPPADPDAPPPPF